ncbi:MAG: hypothetical protein ABR524_13020 [Thermoanaerobaculia bacterium]
MIWREKRWLLVTLGIIFLANLVFFVTYRVRFEQRVNDLETRREAVAAELTTARAERATAEQNVKSFEQIVATVDTVYNDWWATPQERLVPLLNEMRELARRSELQPPSTSYNQTQAARDQGSDAALLAISFSVRGTYEQARRLINLIEYSDEFVFIEEISLASGSGDSQLVLTLRLKTLFRADDEPARSAS